MTHPRINNDFKDKWAGKPRRTIIREESCIIVGKGDEIWVGPWRMSGIYIKVVEGGGNIRRVNYYEQRWWGWKSVWLVWVSEDTDVSAMKVSL